PSLAPHAHVPFLPTRRSSDLLDRVSLIFGRYPSVTLVALRYSSPNADHRDRQQRHHDHRGHELQRDRGLAPPLRDLLGKRQAGVDRKSTRLNSSHVSISYAVL